MNIKVSCHIITYNQRAYISKCIDGMLMQKTNFLFEIIVGDDNSSDGTREILIEYQNKYPEIIRLNFRDKRGDGIPGKDNFMSTYSLCVGKYIALCEGDDYWTDQLKLQKQVDFLEANPDYVLSCHKVAILDGELFKEDNINTLHDNYEQMETLAKHGNYIHTPSVVFRNIIQPLPEEFNDSPLGDFFLYMLLAQHGKLNRQDDVMAVYRFSSGVWSGQSSYSRNFKTTLTHTLLYKYFNSIGNAEIATILLSRIQSFIRNFISQISPEDLNRIVQLSANKNNVLELRFAQSIISKILIETEPERTIERIGIKQLIKHLTLKIRKKLVRS